MSRVVVRLLRTYRQRGQRCATHSAFGSTPSATEGGGVQWGISAGHAAVVASAVWANMATPVGAPFGTRIAHS
eukprot:873561-Lingulodinium_polyedra.AAC.1